jgi:hypothetical protein
MVENVRNYKCKDEELPVICRNALLNMRKDMRDFAAYSPIFNEDYARIFAEKIDSVDELLTPKIETDELKKITKRLYRNMDNLLDPITKVRGYLHLAKDSVGVSAKDFGLTLLRQKIASRDSEGVRQNLLVVNSFLDKYKTQLTAVGLGDDVIRLFKSSVASISEDNQRQFDILNRRKDIVQKNLKILNDLYKQLMDILNIGKSLYQVTNAAKSKEYTFNTLLRSVRNAK